MTRKRFIKLLMSMGSNRNKAQATAKNAIEEYGSYQKAWDALPILTVGTFRKALESFRELSKRIKEAFSGAVMPAFEELSESMRKYSESIQEAMKVESKDNCRHRACAGHRPDRCQGRPGILPGAVRRRPPYRRTAPTG